MISLVVTLTIFALGAIVVNTVGWTLVNVALLISIPLTVGNGIMVPLHACRHFKISLTEYISHVFFRPLACSLPLCIIFYVSRTIFPVNHFVVIGFGTILGGLVTGVLYWRFLLPEGFRTKVVHFMYKNLPFLKTNEKHGLG